MISEKQKANLSSEKFINLIEKLMTEAKEPTMKDGDVVNDYASGNIDDAYYFGWDEGRSSMAMEIKEILDGD